jgi:enoyl-CoA hydratase
MNDYRNLTFIVTDGLGLLTINRPEVLNALNREVVAEIGEVVDSIGERDDVDILVVTGAGKAFVAGADIEYMSRVGVLEGRDFTRFGQSVMNRLEKLDIPTVAAVNGFALGGGCELAMACDIRIASEKAKFGQPEVSLGIIPGFGGTQRLPRLVGSGAAKHLIFSGEIIGAEEAFRIGLVQKVLPLDGFLDAVIEYARGILTKAPIAVRMSKIAIGSGAATDVVTGVAFEAEASAVAFGTEDKREGMQAFLEKRAPVFKKK